MGGKRRSFFDGTNSRLISLLTVLLVGASFVLAQSGPGKTGSASQSSGPSPSAKNKKGDIATMPQIRVQSNLVTAPVTVTDKVTGEFVYGLNKSDFEILDNGKPQRITEFSREPNKVAVVILIQNNETVAPLLNQIKQLAPMFSQLMLGPKGEAAVITFNSTIKIDQSFSSSEATLDKTLHAIRDAGTKARLNDALMQAMNLLSERPRTERRIILAFSTGHDSGSVTSKTDVIRRATSTEVEIYGLGLSLSKSYLDSDKQPMNTPANPENQNVALPPTPGVPNTPSSSMGTFGATVPVGGAIKAAMRGVPGIVFSNAVQTYASYTGGKFYSQWSSTGLQVHLSEIASDIHSQYLLAYVPNDLSELGFHALEVKVIGHGKKIKVQTRRGYFYEGPKQ